MKQCLLDSSFVIDLLNEIEAGEEGVAMAWIRANPRARLFVTPITLAEVLEGAQDPKALSAELGRFAWQGIHRAHALRVAARQRKSSRRLGENDAWQIAIADAMGAHIVGHDAAFATLGTRYEDHRRRRSA